MFIILLILEIIYRYKPLLSELCILVASHLYGVLIIMNLHEYLGWLIEHQQSNPGRSWSNTIACLPVCEMDNHSVTVTSDQDLHLPAGRRRPISGQEDRQKQKMVTLQPPLLLIPCPKQVNDLPLRNRTANQIALDLITV